MSITTNIIQNVYYATGNTACSAGTQYCSDGYSLYFPCLKDITRGQDVCFNFYVADNSTQDVVNLDNVDAITLSLSGQYGCQYGSYSYPDNIFSLQKNSYSLKYSCEFDDRNLCELSLASVDINDLNTFINVKEGNFYSGTNVEVSAYDTPTHLFIGWAIFEETDDTCDEETVEDYIVSTSNVYKFVISEDTRLFALYRPRKKYDIVIDSSNEKSHYNVTYKTTTYHISNRPGEIYDDGYDKVSDVLEGYSVRIECIPNISILDETALGTPASISVLVYSHLMEWYPNWTGTYYRTPSQDRTGYDKNYAWVLDETTAGYGPRPIILYTNTETPTETSQIEAVVSPSRGIIGYLGDNFVYTPPVTPGNDSDDDYSYKFVEWKDGNKNRIRVIHPGTDTSAFERGNEIRLYSVCYGPVAPYDIESDTTPLIDYFDEEGIHIITGQSSTSIVEYTGDEYTKSVENVYLKSIEDNVYLLINNGELVLSSMDITDEIQINIQAMTDEDCELVVEVNGTEVSNTISPEDDETEIKEYFFNECGGSDIVIRTSGKCLISGIEVYKVNITDKGLAMFCLQKDTVIMDYDGNEILFEDIPTGPLYVSGAIMVNGSTYGLSQVQIGNINKLNKISII